MTMFRVWAPSAGQVTLQVSGQQTELTATSGGWWQADVTAEAEARYGFRIDGGDLLPDPASPRQPDGPPGLSQRYDQTAFQWTDDGWRGYSLPGAVVYELHIGTFTTAGTFDAAIEHLDHLTDLGVDAVEVMPVASFPGDHGWGYDGISLWAVHEPYGGPDGFKRFIDACHARHLAVLLDVVYNHVGIGNRLADFGPYFTDAHTTPWGPAVNLDQPGSDEVRAFIIGNALMWLRDYHLDGLRLDAVHALADTRAVHLLEELSGEVAALAAAAGRDLVLIAESDANNPRLVTSIEAGGYGLTGQWSDDFHHALHSALTGERQGYYRDFGSLAALAHTITSVFYHDGRWSSFRGRSHGRPVDRLTTPAYRFVSFLQDHDQVGNRAAGDRISASVSPGLLKVGAGLLLTIPFTPMLFMGEEWGASTPWQYFTDHRDPELGAAVSQGRRAEFARHGWQAGEVPDPQDPATFTRSRLNWTERETPPHGELLQWYRQLIALRRRRSELTDPRLTTIDVRVDENARWLLVRRGTLRILANLAGASQPVALDDPVAELIAGSAPGIEWSDRLVVLPPESLAILRVH